MKLITYRHLVQMLNIHQGVYLLPHMLNAQFLIKHKENITFFTCYQLFSSFKTDNFE
jgi:hypothetical protein